MVAQNPMRTHLDWHLPPGPRGLLVSLVGPIQHLKELLLYKPKESDLMKERKIEKERGRERKEKEERK